MSVNLANSGLTRPCPAAANSRETASSPSLPLETNSFAGARPIDNTVIPRCCTRLNGNILSHIRTLKGRGPGEEGRSQ